MPPKKKEGGKSKKKKGKSEPSPEELERVDLLQNALSCREETVSLKELEGRFLEQSEVLKQYWEVEKNWRNVSSVGVRICINCLP